MKVPPIPTNEQMIDNRGNLTIPWLNFFQGLYNGDTGTEWTPTFVGLAETGTATFTGRIYRIGQRLAYFTITVTPATDTTSTAGVTYCDNFPMTLSANGTCLASSGVIGSSGGMCLASSNRIYTPAWAAFTTPVTVAGLVEAR